MAPSPRKKNLGLANSRGGMYIDFVKKDSIDSYFDRWGKKMDEISNEMRKMNQHVTRLEHEARQPRLAMEADGPAETTKTRERTGGAATVSCIDTTSSEGRS